MISCKLIPQDRYDRVISKLKYCWVNQNQTFNHGNFGVRVNKINRIREQLFLILEINAL